MPRRTTPSFHMSKGKPLTRAALPRLVTAKDCTRWKLNSSMARSIAILKSRRASIGPSSRPNPRRAFTIKTSVENIAPPMCDRARENDDPTDSAPPSALRPHVRREEGRGFRFVRARSWHGCEELSRPAPASAARAAIHIPKDGRLIECTARFTFAISTKRRRTAARCGRRLNRNPCHSRTGPRGPAVGTETSANQACAS